MFALLIDPDKTNAKQIEKTVNLANESKVDIILVGGSLIAKPLHETISLLKRSTNIPIVLFPGSPMQLDKAADALFLLSLISGRNADYLIGNHVIAAPFIRSSNLEVIPVGYILINCGSDTSVSYMSNSMPIPYEKNEIAIATALAGEMTGNKIIYLEGGSGAQKPVNPRMIESVKENINIPLIVGGGIRSINHIQSACQAGADIIVVGTAIEKNPLLLYKMVETIHSM